MDQPIKLDLGCGKNKREGFFGVDCLEFPGVDLVTNLVEVELLGDDKSQLRCTTKFKKWPWEDDSVEEMHASHFVEHLTPAERVHFVNEACRVLIKGGKCTIIVPCWSSCRAYGDLTHQWPPVAEFWFFYLSKDWRKDNAPHNDFYTCDFDTTWGYVPNPYFQTRSQESQMFAFQFYKDAVMDIVATLVKR